jgi:cytidylate kinase
MIPGSMDRDANLTRLVEEKLRNWQASAKSPPRSGETQHEVHDFMTISRLVGTDGHAVAEPLSQRLGWPVFDREILHAMAGNDRVRERVYQTLDERDVGWIEDTLRYLVERGIDKEHYFHRLSETVLALARRGPAIFMGRGADLILPRNRGFRVDLVAPIQYRVHNIATRQNLSEVAARTELDRLQSERRDFLRSHFGPRAEDPARFDLVINLASVPASQAVELITMALRLHHVVR